MLKRENTSTKKLWEEVMAFTFLLSPLELKWLANQLCRQLIKPLLSTSSKVLIPEPSMKQDSKSLTAHIHTTDISKFNFNIIFPYSVARDSVVGIATRYGLYGPGVES
jgi:hypothetical protein